MGLQPYGCAGRGESYTNLEDNRSSMSFNTSMQITLVQVLQILSFTEAMFGIQPYAHLDTRAAVLGLPTSANLIAMRTRRLLSGGFLITGRGPTADPHPPSWGTKI